VPGKDISCNDLSAMFFKEVFHSLDGKSALFMKCDYIVEK
jgi:hypothetical protein